jgi:tetratricopeptide (TPR) repeat protein
MIGWLGVVLHYGETRDTLNATLLKKVIIERVNQDPSNADLYQALGDIYYSEKNFADAVATYQRALKYNKNQLQALNNLAWLYATCDDSRFRNPQRALELSLYATALSNESYILDTLAEAYFVNNDLNSALMTAEKALAAATHNVSYYMEQLIKFQKAVLSRQTPP